MFYSLFIFVLNNRIGTKMLSSGDGWFETILSRGEDDERSGSKQESKHE